jgi:hypothetical protein
MSGSCSVAAIATVSPGDSCISVSARFPFAALKTTARLSPFALEILIPKYGREGTPPSCNSEVRRDVFVSVMRTATPLPALTVVGIVSVARIPSDTNESSASVDDVVQLVALNKINKKVIAPRAGSMRIHLTENGNRGLRVNRGTGNQRGLAEAVRKKAERINANSVLVSACETRVSRAAPLPTDDRGAAQHRGPFH